MLSVDHSNIDDPPLAVKCVRKFGSALGGEITSLCLSLSLSLSVCVCSNPCLDTGSNTANYASSDMQHAIIGLLVRHCGTFFRRIGDHSSTSRQYHTRDHWKQNYISSILRYFLWVGYNIYYFTQTLRSRFFTFLPNIPSFPAITALLVKSETSHGDLLSALHTSAVLLKFWNFSGVKYACLP